MKTVICLSVLSGFFLTGPIFASDVASTNKEPVDTTKSYYILATAKIYKAIAQAESCSNAEAVLESIESKASDINYSLTDTNNIDWKEKRFQSACGVLANLALLENSLKATEIALTIKPPRIVMAGGNQEYALVPMPDMLVTNAIDRERLLAYRSALQASGKLNNLRQSLIAQYDHHSEHAFNLIVSAYSSALANSMEVSNLITVFGNTDCGLRFSKKLNLLKK